jgi:hypothetical protein
MPRSIALIARDIRQDWQNVNYAAKPYLEAMQSLTSITDNYGADTAQSVVLYFLCNANTWRGQVARSIKAELKALTKPKGQARKAEARGKTTMKLGSLAQHSTIANL